MSMQRPAAVTASRQLPSLAAERLRWVQLDQLAAVAQPLLTIPER
jgi:hypothetical protein